MRKILVWPLALLLTPFVLAWGLWHVWRRKRPDREKALLEARVIVMERERAVLRGQNHQLREQLAELEGDEIVRRLKEGDPWI